MPVSTKHSGPQPVQPDTQSPSRLNSWKEIASYFDRDVRTVQLWEKREGLPVHRHEHGVRSSVYAVPSELETWFTLRKRNQPASTVASALPAAEKPGAFLSETFLYSRGVIWSGVIFVLLILMMFLPIVRKVHRSYAAAPQSLIVVLADFVNTTGEPVFDDTLNTALRAKLQQSPYLPLMSDARLQTALQYMRRPTNERLTLDTAREVCQREGGQVVLQGSIAGIARGYVVGLRAVDCHTGKLLAEEQEPVEFRMSVLQGLDRVTEAMRPALGESGDSIRRYSVSLDDATTGSLEALAAYTQANRLWNTQGESVALPLFEHAVQVDPNFAIAWARLGTIYGNMGESQRSNAAMRKAYDLRNRVTEWERFYIASHYFGFVTGDIPNEMQAYQQWAQAYPHDMAWTVNLSVDYGITGQLDKAIDLQKRAILEIPGLSPAYGDLAQFYLAANRPDEAQSVLDQAAQAHVQDSNTRLAAYGLAFYRNQPAAMATVANETTGTPGVEDLLLDQQAATADSQGRLTEGLALAERAATTAEHAGNHEIAMQRLAAEAVRQAAFGRTETAHLLLSRTLPASKDRNVALLSSLALLLGTTSASDLTQVRHAIEKLNHDDPADSIIQSYWLPVLRARIAYATGNAAQVPDLLQGTAPYDLGVFIPGQCMDATYIHAQSLLAVHQPTAAAAEFHRILDHRGLVLNCPTLPLSQLGLAESFALAGDAASARTAYQDLFANWQNADPQLPLLRRAHAEYARL